MKLITINLLVAALSTAFILSSCQKQDDKSKNVTPAPGTGKVKIELANAVGDQQLVLNNQWYVNQNGDSFTVSKFNYYISNIKLTGPNGASYTEAESYHFISQEETGTKTFDVANVPAGTYNSITFTIGVDSLRNVSGAQTDALDPIHGMFWTWNSGYIFMKMEGHSPKSADSTLTFHIGGYEGENRGQRTVTLSLPSSLTVNSNNPHMHIRANLLSLFGSPNVVNFSTTSYMMMPSAETKKIADNYEGMMSVILVE